MVILDCRSFGQGKSVLTDIYQVSGSPNWVTEIPIGFYARVHTD